MLFGSESLSTPNACALKFVDAGKTYLTITPDGKIELGGGLSEEEAMQGAARAIAKQYQRQMDPT